jgi:hypothetical protein
MLKDKQPPNKDVEAALEGIHPMENFHFKQMGWLRPQNEKQRALSAKIAGGMADDRYETFDAVMEAAVMKGLKPFDPEGFGLYLSWVIVNFPSEGGEDTDLKHTDKCTRLGLWNFASARKGFSNEEKAAFGRALSVTHSFGEKTQEAEEAAAEFVGKVGAERAIEVFDSEHSEGYIAFQRREPVVEDGKVVHMRELERSDVNERYPDKQLLTQDGYAAGKEQGWLMEDRSYTIHRNGIMNLLVWGVFNHLERNVRRHLNPE